LGADTDMKLETLSSPESVYGLELPIPSVLKNGAVC